MKNRACAAALLLAGLLGQAAARAQDAGAVLPGRGAPVQTPQESLAEDAAEYARANAVGVEEAMRRLRAQEESVAQTDRLAERYRDRLAGLAIEHDPDFRIVVLLTGSAPVRERSIVAGGMRVPVVFRTGAAATRDRIVEAMRRHQAAIRAAFLRPPGMGLDQRTGELVLVVSGDDAGFADRAEMEALTGVPVRIDTAEASGADLAVEGGSRVEGVDPRDGRRYACTTGFVVTDMAGSAAARTGIVTAAHCPDDVTYYDPRGGQVPLRFGGQWGVGFQDVQLHLSDEALQPLFHADAARSAVRMLTGARRRTSTRAGEAVCHRGEASGYSCSTVELTDFAPPGDLCAGPCDPVWVTVRGPSCRNGDSGGPIFSGTTAFGIVKGGSYDGAGRCSFYFYMSTDYLPDGWSLLRADEGDPEG